MTAQAEFQETQAKGADFADRTLAMMAVDLVAARDHFEQAWLKFQALVQARGIELPPVA